MLSLLDFARDAGFDKTPVSLNEVVRKFGVDNVRDAIARHKFDDTYWRCCGSASSLGAPRGEVVKRPDGSYYREYSLRTLNLTNTEANMKVNDPSVATVQLAAVKCFGTDDAKRDEPFVVVSMVSVDVTQQSSNNGVYTWRSEIVDDIGGGRVFLNDGRMISPDGGIKINGAGLHITVSVWDHDTDDPDKIKAQISRLLEEGAKKAAEAIAGASADKGSDSLKGPIGDFSRFEIGGFKPFKFVADAAVDILGLGDDHIGTHTYQLTARQLDEFTRNYDFRLEDGLAAKDSFNVPTRDDFDGSLLSSGDGGGSYKVYLRVRVAKAAPIVFNNDPPIVHSK